MFHFGASTYNGKHPFVQTSWSDSAPLAVQWKTAMFDYGWLRSYSWLGVCTLF